MNERIVVNFTPGGKVVTHGGAGTAYANYGCRCEDCTEANRLRIERRRNERDPNYAPKHGLASTYSNWNCRCDDCKESHKIRMSKNYRDRRDRGLKK